MSILRSSRWIEIPENISIIELIQQNVSNTPSDKIIYEDALTGRTTTYGEFGDRVRSAAHWLKHTLHFQPGQTVCIISPSSTDYIISAHAIWWAGGVVSPVNNSLHALEISHIIDLVTPDFLIIHDSVYDKISKSLAQCQKPRSIRILTLGAVHPAWTSFPVDVRNRSHSSEMTPASLNGRRSSQVLAAIMLSSGTTGKPKAVMLSHHNLVSALCQLRADNPNNWRGSQREIFFPPLSHVYALYVCITGAAWLGSYVCLMPRFDIGLYCRLLQDRQATLARLVPPIAKMLGESSVVQKYRYPCLEYFSCSAAPLTAEVASNLAKAFPGVTLCQTYGCTELSGPCAQSGVRDVGLPLSAAGKLIANTEMRFINSQGQDVGVKGPGEITVRGPNVMMGYKDDLNATQEAILEGEWYRTGDLGYVDERGYLIIYDRIKDIIKYKGFQVSPVEIEEILIKHPLVHDAAVCGVWSESDSSELPRAYIVLKPGLATSAKAKAEAAASISDFVSGQVSTYKKLTGGVVFLDALPKNPTGKILRRVLRADQRLQQIEPVLAKL